MSMRNALEDATVLVTGGAGLIGSHIVDALIRERAGHVRVFDNLARGRLANLTVAEDSDRFTFHAGDVRDRRVLERAMRNCDYVFHYAATHSSRCARRPRECVEVLVDGTFNVFEAAAAAGVKKIVYAASAGPALADVSANDPRTLKGRRTLYHSVKQTNEGIAHYFHDCICMSSAGLRFSAVFGPRMTVAQEQTDMIVRWLDRIEEGGRPQIQGDGSEPVVLTYVDDIARANIVAIRSEQDDAIYDVAPGTKTSVLGLWHAVQNVTGAHQVEPEFLASRRTDATPYEPSRKDEYCQEMHLADTVPLEEGLRRLVAWRNQVLASELEECRP
jgi:UDP-glucose 4-epimerase